MPSLFLSAATATRSTEWTFLPKLGAPTIQVSQISFVVWLVKPVRLKRLARFCAFFAPTVVVERSTISPGNFSSTPAEKLPGQGPWFWCVVGPVSWKSAPLAARLGYRRARSTKKPLLCLPATSPGWGAKTCTWTGEAFFEARPLAAAVAVAATTAASARREKAVSNVRLCTGILLWVCGICSYSRTPRAGAYPRGGASKVEAPRAWASLRDEQAVHEELNRSGGQARGLDAVRAREGVDLEPVVRGLRVTNRDDGVKTLRRHLGRVPEGPDRVVAVSAVDDNTVGLPVAGGAAEGACEVDGHVPDVGAGEVVDGHEVGAAEGVDVDQLHAGRVHRDVALSAEELEAASVCRQIDLLGAAGAVEHHRVDAVLAFDGVAAVAGIPDEAVVAGAEVRGVVAAVAIARVVAVAAEPRLGPCAAGERVVSFAAVDSQGDRLGCECRGRGGVVTAQTVDVELVARVLMLDRDLRRKPCHGDSRGISGDVDLVVAASAVDGHLVGLSVAGCAAEGAGEVRVDRLHVGAAEGVEVNLLDPGGVHHDPAGIAKELESISVCRQGDALGDVGAVEDHRVGAVLAFNDVAAVAWIPDEAGVAGAEQGVVVAAVAVDRVVAVAAEQRLGAFAARDRVVSCVAVDRRRDGVGEGPVALVDAHDVVALSGVDGDVRDLRALEAEVGRAVVADVDLENAGVAGLQTKRDPVASVGALDRQHPVPELRVLELVRLVCVRGLGGVSHGRRLTRAGRDPSRASDGCDQSNRRSRQPHGPYAARLVELKDVSHRSLSE